MNAPNDPVRELGEIARRYWKFPDPRGRAAMLRERLKQMAAENPNGGNTGCEARPEDRQEEPRG
jgi:hypothetical protein